MDWPLSFLLCVIVICASVLYVIRRYGSDSQRDRVDSVRRRLDSLEVANAANRDKIDKLTPQAMALAIKRAGKTHA